MTLRDIQDAVRAGHTRVGAHAIREAAADKLLIAEIWDGIIGAQAQIIEDYPSDPRGPSCLVYCEVQGLPEHVVIAFPSAPAAQRMMLPGFVFMITCYRPGGSKHASQWAPDFKRRLP